jgi:hypothetical protein
MAEGLPLVLAPLVWRSAANDIECALRGDQEYRIVPQEDGYRLHRIPATTSWWRRRTQWCATRVAARALAEEWGTTFLDRKSKARNPK